MLISKLAGIPCEDIPDDHPDVVILSDISAEELSNRLWKSTDSDLLDAYFIALGLEKAEAKAAHIVTRRIHQAPVIRRIYPAEVRQVQPSDYLGPPKRRGDYHSPAFTPVSGIRSIRQPQIRSIM